MSTPNEIDGPQCKISTDFANNSYQYRYLYIYNNNYNRKFNV